MYDLSSGNTINIRFKYDYTLNAPIILNQGKYHVEN
jgi:hypothetical protein